LLVIMKMLIKYYYNIHGMLAGLPEYIRPLVIILADIIAKKGKTTSGELYKRYNTAILGFEKKDEYKLLSERRILDLINELDTIGLVTTWNFSKGRGGYGKEIVLNTGAERILEFYKPKTKNPTKK
jgi:Cdc6-like AAA superfamily ATPase